MPSPTAASSIIAQAFRLMEMAPVSSTADDTPQARDAAEQYPEALTACLEACDWSFASALVALPEEAALPDGLAADPDLPYSFALPGDCVRLIGSPDPYVRFRRDGDMLRANQAGPLLMRYTRRVESEALLPATFKAAVSARLAASLSLRWNGAEGKAAQAEDRARARLAEAMRADARQATPLRYDGQADTGFWHEEAVR